MTVSMPLLSWKSDAVSCLNIRWVIYFTPALRRIARANGGNVRFLRDVSTRDLLRSIDQSISDEIELNNNDYNA